MKNRTETPQAIYSKRLAARLARVPPKRANQYCDYRIPEGQNTPNYGKTLSFPDLMELRIIAFLVNTTILPWSCALSLSETASQEMGTRYPLSDPRFIETIPSPSRKVQQGLHRSQNQHPGAPVDRRLNQPPGQHARALGYIPGTLTSTHPAPTS